MKNRSFAMTIGCLMVLAVTCPASGEGWKLPNLNPFSTRDDSAARARITDDRHSGFGLPALPSLPKPSLPKIDLVPSWSATPERRASEPSTWDKISSGTKSFFTKTKATLMPWASSSNQQPARRSATGTRRVQRSAANTRPKKSETKPSFFSSWFSPKPEEKKLETVNDFLSLPPVPYE